MFKSYLIIILPLLIISCTIKHSKRSTASLSEGLSGEIENPEITSALQSVNPYAEGFSLIVSENGTTDYTFKNAKRRVLLNDIGYFGDKLDQVADLGKTRDGYTVFTWPKESEVIDRDYNRLSALMNEYSKTVGIFLGGTPKGKGERQWIRGGMRGTQWSAIAGAFKYNSAEAFCEEAVSQLVERFVTGGSKYRQYGNCGEGRTIGACLSLRSGFKPSEIRMCLTASRSHAFAMVKGKTRRDKWCILDRWDLIGHFRCGVDLNNKRQVTIKGRPTRQSWFQNVSCATLESFIEYNYNKNTNLEFEPFKTDREVVQTSR